jgi:glycosyltransferase involved in cell wall biosynthesis
MNEKALSVVFFSHDSGLSGANRSLLDLQAGLKEQGVICTTILPGEGSFDDILKESGIPTIILSKEQSSQRAWQWVRWPKDEFDFPAEEISKTYTLLLNHLIPELKKIGPDVIFSQTIVSPWGSVCAGQLGIPHALSAREYGESDHNLTFLFGYQESLKALYACSDVVFSVTKDVRDTLFGPDPDQKAIVVYNGIRLDFSGIYDANKTDGSKYEANWQKGVRVGVFGTIMKSKGQEDIIRACLELCQRGYNINCLLAGAAPGKEYYQCLEQMIASSGFPERFKLYDFLNDPYQLMKEVDIIVSCSQMEALGRTLFESVLLYRPIIYADSGGPKEVFTDGVHGLSYKAGDYRGLADRILLTINDLESTKKRISSANEYVINNFSRAKYVSLVREKLETLKDKKQTNSHQNAIPDLFKSRGIELKPKTSLQPKLYYYQAAGGYKERQSILKNYVMNPTYSSISWHITKPLREFRHFLHKIFHK